MSKNSNESSSNIRPLPLSDLIKKLTEEEELQELMEGFILTYPNWVDSISLFKTLEKEIEKSKKEKKEELISNRVQLFLKRWITLRYFEYFENKELQQLLKHFIQKMPTRVSMTFEIIIEGMGKTYTDLTKDITHKSDSKLPSLSAMNQDSSEAYLELIAQQMTHIEYSNLKKVRIDEYIHQAWNKDKKNENAPNLVFCIQWFNKMSHWFCTEILKEEKVELRGIAITNAIKIAKKFQTMNNFNGIMEILSSLHNSSISRLKASWKGVSNKNVEEFEELSQLMSPKGNFKNYRTFLSKVKPPCIPYVGVCLTDLTFIDDCNPDFYGKLINISKVSLLGDTIRDIRNHTDTEHSQLKVIPSIRDALLSSELVTLDEKSIWQLSKLREDGITPTELGLSDLLSPRNRTGNNNTTTTSSTTNQPKSLNISSGSTVNTGTLQTSTNSSNATNINNGGGLIPISSNLIINKHRKYFVDLNVTGTKKFSCEFQDLSSRDYTLLESLGMNVTFSHDELIIGPDSTNFYVYRIKSGTVKAESEGQEEVILESGSIFGEISLVTNDMKVGLKYTVLSQKVELIVIPIHQILSLSSQQSFQKRFLKRIVFVLYSAVERMVNQFTGENSDSSHSNSLHLQTSLKKYEDGQGPDDDDDDDDDVYQHKIIEEKEERDEDEEEEEEEEEDEEEKEEEEEEEEEEEGDEEKGKSIDIIHEVDEENHHNQHQHHRHHQHHPSHSNNTDKRSIKKKPKTDSKTTSSFKKPAKSPTIRSQSDIAIPLPRNIRKDQSSPTKDQPLNSNENSTKGSKMVESSESYPTASKHKKYQNIDSSPSDVVIRYRKKNMMVPSPDHLFEKRKSLQVTTSPMNELTSNKSSNHAIKVNGKNYPLGRSATLNSFNPTEEKYEIEDIEREVEKKICRKLGMRTTSTIIYQFNCLFKEVMSFKGTLYIFSKEIGFYSSQKFSLEKKWVYSNTEIRAIQISSSEGIIVCVVCKRSNKKNNLKLSFENQQTRDRVVELISNLISQAGSKTKMSSNTWKRKQNPFSQHTLKENTLNEQQQQQQQQYTRHHSYTLQKSFPSPSTRHSSLTCSSPTSVFSRSSPSKPLDIPPIQLSREPSIEKVYAGSLTQEDWKVLLNSAKKEIYQKNQIILNDQSKDQRIIRIISGKAAAILHYDSPTPSFLSSFGEGEIVGVETFLGDKPIATIVSEEENTEVLSIQGYFVCLLLEMQPNFSVRFWRFLGSVLYYYLSKLQSTKVTSKPNLIEKIDNQT